MPQPRKVFGIGKTYSVVLVHDDLHEVTVLKAETTTELIEMMIIFINEGTDWSTRGDR
jgi:hypothetical protein